MNLTLLPPLKALWPQSTAGIQLGSTINTAYERLSYPWTRTWVTAHVREPGAVTRPSMGSCLAFHDDDDDYDDGENISQTHRISLICILITHLCQTPTFTIHTLGGFVFCFVGFCCCFFFNHKAIWRSLNTSSWCLAPSNPQVTSLSLKMRSDCTRDLLQNNLGGWGVPDWLHS